MGNRLSYVGLRRVALGAACAGALGIAVPATVDAATAPPPIVPTPLTNCYGTLAHDHGAKSDQPNLVDYNFECSTPIQAYTIVYNQSGAPDGTLDDFDSSPIVYETDAVTPSPTETVTCAATLPSDGINCNTPALGKTLDAYFHVAGAINPVQPYCKHLPTYRSGKLAKPGTPAIGKARADLIVTDNTGAQDGPFYLGRVKPCTVKVPDRVPRTTSTGTSTKKKPSPTAAARRPAAS